MTKWYDSSGVYVGYSAFYNGAIHYYTVAANGVVTDLGTTKPVLFDTTCCDSGATAVKVRDAGILSAGSFTNFNFGLNQPSLFTTSYTNTSTVPVLFTLHLVTFRTIQAPAGQQYLQEVTSLASSIPAISYAFNASNQYHRDDFEHNQAVPKEYTKYDQASTHVFLLAVGQTVSFTGGYAFASNTIPTVAGNVLEFKLSYQVVEA